MTRFVLFFAVAVCGNFVLGKTLQVPDQTQPPDQVVSGQPSPGQPSPGQPSPGQPMPGQPMPGQPMPGQPMPGQPMPGQPMPGQPMPGQPMPGQPMPGQPMPGQPMPGQPMPGQPMPGQPMPGQPMPGQPMPGYPIDVSHLVALLDQKFAQISQRLDNIEKEQARERQVNLKLCDEGFVSRRSVPPCTDEGAMQSANAIALKNEPSQSNGPNTTQPTKVCNTQDCAEAYIPARRLSTTWITAYKTVTITKEVPYVEVVKVWDQKLCCYNSVFETKTRTEQRDMVVPYKKEVICEEVGMEKIKVCLAD